jgi:hypothetical protein
MTSLKLTLLFGLVAAYGGTAQAQEKPAKQPSGPLGGQPLPGTKQSVPDLEEQADDPCTTAILCRMATAFAR